LFPESCRAQVRDILLFKNFAAGQLLDDLSAFSLEEQNLLFDRNLMEDWVLTQFTLEQIEQLKDKQLKSEFIQLYNKVHGLNSEPPPSIFSRVVSFIVSPLFHKETIEDWAYQFGELKRRSANNLTAMIQPKIEEKLRSLASHLSTLKAEATGSKVLDEKIDFLEEKIAAEEGKSGVMIRRFENLDQLYDFEIALKNFNTAPAGVSVTRNTVAQILEKPSLLEEEDILTTEMPSYSCW
jgi:hypothetical protein